MQEYIFKVQKITTMVLVGCLLFANTIQARQPDDYPDLIVKDIARVEERLFAGHKGSYKIEIENIGKRTAFDARVAIEFHNERVCSAMFSLGAGETRTIWCGFTTHLGGVLPVSIIIDERKDVAELREDNNWLHKDFPVIPAEERSDIGLSRNMMVSNDVIHSGDDVEFSVPVLNHNKWETGGFSVNWYIGDSENPTCSERLELGPQGSTHARCVVRDIQSEDGELTVTVIADEHDRIAETMENNNRVEHTFAVLPARINPIEFPGAPQITTQAAVDEVVSQDVPVDELSFEARANLLFIETQQERDKEAETAFMSQDFVKLRLGLPQLTLGQEYALRHFAVYGIDTRTRELGVGERTAVLHSYKYAYNKLPTTTAELADVLRIAHGLWPVEQSSDAQNAAHKAFYKVYGRVANMSDDAERTAITIISYGTRQEVRDVEKEKQGIEVFERTYHRHPSSIVDWNIVQAITYAGVE